MVSKVQHIQINSSLMFASKIIHRKGKYDFYGVRTSPWLRKHEFFNLHGYLANLV